MKRILLYLGFVIITLSLAYTTDCDYSGYGHWVIDDGSNCDITTDVNVSSGYIFILNGSLNLDNASTIYSNKLYINYLRGSLRFENGAFKTTNFYNFTPTDIDSLLFWFDASDNSTITQSSGLVSQWDDKSLNAETATQSLITRRPQYISNDRIDFDGVDNGLLLSNVGINNTNVTILFVALDQVQPAGASIWRPLLASGVGDLSFNSNGNKWGFGFLRGGSDGIGVAFGNGTSIPSYIINHVPNNQPRIVGFRFDGSNMSLVRDTIIGTNTNTFVNLNAAVYSNYAIGLDALGVNREYDGYIKTALAFNSSLSNSELNQVGNFLANTYGAVWTDIS